MNIILIPMKDYNPTRDGVYLATNSYGAVGLCRWENGTWYHVNNSVFVIDDNHYLIDINKE
jgi:hypothetical protein